MTTFSLNNKQMVRFISVFGVSETTEKVSKLLKLVNYIEHKTLAWLA